MYLNRFLNTGGVVGNVDRAFMNIAFDVDGTLIDGDDKPIEANIELLKALAKSNVITVWSGGGEAYARLWVSRLGLVNLVHNCSSKIGCKYAIDLAIDDQNVNLATYNIRINRNESYE